jgi:hypothetical protein
MARPRKWEGANQGEREAARQRALRAAQRTETPQEAPPGTGLRCRQCRRLKRELEETRRGWQRALLRTFVREPVDIDPEGARYRMAARLCNVLLVKYAPREDWAEWERLNPWLLEVEVARRKEPGANETAEQAIETRAA